MYKRLELHNHTTESDASITTLELLEHMVNDKVDAFAITDHNTISGQDKIEKQIKEKGYDIQLIKGMELTTYYGHILCLNLTQYIDWEDIDIDNPEKLFKRAREKGALAGVAHPFSYGAPFARGCRFDMKITDYSQVYFIEISNDLEPLHEVNERGLLYWQDLVFKGENLAATAGMDLHGKWDMSDNFATYLEGEKNGDIQKELENAIKTQRTWVSKGPILECTVSDKALLLKKTGTNKPGYKESGKDYRIVLSTKEKDLEIVLGKNTEITVDLDDIEGKIIIPKLYRGEAIMENLVCVSPVIRL